MQRPVTDYLAMQGRFGHMLPEQWRTAKNRAKKKKKNANCDGVRHPGGRLGEFQPGDAIECYTVERVVQKL